MIMDTSKTYYETVMRDYNRYKRGRTLEQFCRDEAVDFQWLAKAQKQYGETEETQKKKIFRPSKGKAAEVPEMIKLHYDEDALSEEAAAMAIEAPASASTSPECDPNSENKWTVARLTVTTPAGDDIEISCRKPSAVMELLSKLAV